MDYKSNRYNLLINALEVSSATGIMVSNRLIKEAKTLAGELNVTYPDHTKDYVGKPVGRLDKLVGLHNGKPIYRGTTSAKLLGL